MGWKVNKEYRKNPMRTFSVIVFSVLLFTSLVHGQVGESENSGLQVMPYTVLTRGPDGSIVDDHRLKIILPLEVSGKPYEGLDISLGMNPVKGNPLDPNRVPFFENPQFLKNIMAVDYQVEKLTQIKQKFLSSVTEMVKEALENGKGSIDDEAKAELIKQMTALRSEMESAAADVLLPHQIELLKKQRLLSSMNYGIVGALESDEIREELNLTDTQIKEMKALETEFNSEAKKMREEMEKQILDLKKKSKDKMFSILSREQRSRLEDLLGDQ
jgi:hypothetical protein